MDEMHVAIRYNFAACEKRVEEGMGMMGCREGYWEFGIWVGRGHARAGGLHCIAVGSKQCQIAAASASASVVRVFIASSAAAAAQHLNSTENKLFFMTSSVSVLAELGDAAVNQY